MIVTLHWIDVAVILMKFHFVSRLTFKHEMNSYDHITMLS